MQVVPSTTEDPIQVLPEEVVQMPLLLYAAIKLIKATETAIILMKPLLAAECL